MKKKVEKINYRQGRRIKHTTTRLHHSVQNATISQLALSHPGPLRLVGSLLSGPQTAWGGGHIHYPGPLPLPCPMPSTHLYPALYVPSTAQRHSTSPTHTTLTHKPRPMSSTSTQPLLAPLRPHPPSFPLGCDGLPRT